MKDSAAARKFLSDRGASLTYALLLFMTCAAVGIVALAAGSAAAGRLSGLAVMDSRYYAVSSAASLLAELFDGTSVTVTETIEYDSDRTESGREWPQFDSGVLGVCKKTALYCLDEESQSEPLAFDITVKPGNEDGSTIKDTDGNDIVLTFDVSETIDDSGNMQMEIKNHSEVQFALTLIFGQEIKRNRRMISDLDESGNEYTKTEINSTELTWTLKDIKRR